MSVAINRRIQEQAAKLEELEKRIDRIEWDWNRFKKVPEAKKISEAMERLKTEEDL